MKNADILTSLTDMVESAYRTSPTCMSDPHVVKACLALSNIGFQQRERYGLLAAMGLSIWTEAERDAFYNTWEVSWNVMKLVNDPPAEWPQPLPDPEEEPEEPEDPEGDPEEDEE